jgi:hypothetical protein
VSPRGWHPGCTYGTAEVARSPVSVEELRKLQQWILDTCRRPYDQAWLDYQHEIGLRHHRSKKNRTDGVRSVDYIPLRYVVSSRPSP